MSFRKRDGGPPRADEEDDHRVDVEHFKWRASPAKIFLTNGVGFESDRVQLQNGGVAFADDRVRWYPGHMVEMVVFQ